MSDDRLLRALGKLSQAQKEAPVPEALTSPSPAAEARAAERALAALGVEAAPAPRPAAPSATESLWQRLRRRWLVAAVPALAGAMALLLLWPRGGGEGLPGYALEARGGVAETRGEPAPGAGAPLVLEPGSRLELRLRPDQRVSGEVSARFYWVKDGRARRWAVDPEAAPGGAMRVIGAADRPFGPGEGEIVALVGRPQALPTADVLDAASLAAPAPGVRVLRWPIRWP
jgi:ferric-dicitrate binding protein FerR (iron transport regulator)